MGLDPSLAETHNAMAAATLLLDRDLVGAEREFQRALELNPAYVQARCWYGLWYLRLITGRVEESLVHTAQAVETDPLSAYTAAVHAIVLASTGRPAEGIELGLAAVSRDADALLSHWSLHLAYHWGSRFAESVAAGQTALALSGRVAVAVATQASTFADWGKAEEAVALHDELEARSKGEYVQPTALALSATAAGRRNDALTFARRAYEERDPLLIIFGNHWPDLGAPSHGCQVQGALGPSWTEMRLKSSASRPAP